MAATFGFIHKIDETRKYRKLFLVVAFKNDKSTLSAGIGLYLQVADGEAGAEIYAIATKKDHAKIVWLEAKRMVKIELYQSLLIPTAEVPLEEVLEFKEKRKVELIEFRTLIDNLYSEIISSGDQERTKLKSIEELQRKIVEINIVMDESYLKRIAGSF